MAKRLRKGNLLHTHYAGLSGWEGNEPKGNIHILKGNKKVKYTYKKGKVIVTLSKGLKDESLAFSFKAK